MGRKARNTSERRAEPRLYGDQDFEREVEPPDKPEGQEPWRSEFRRDYQRLLHSACFRRLQGKTQLLPSGEHDWFRNRLTHSLEVAQVAHSIAVRLNNTDAYFRNNKIDLDLIQFAALGHDIGHPPFGHNGEEVLDELMRGHGGFEGNAQTLRAIGRLERKATTEYPPTRSFDTQGRDIRRGIGATARALASLLKYDDEIPRTEDGRRKSGSSYHPHKGFYQCDAALVRWIKASVTSGRSAPTKFKTIECSIMDVADDIAYSTYDIEDAFVGGFLSPLSILAQNDGTKEEIAQRINAKLAVEYGDLPRPDRECDASIINQTFTSVFATTLHVDDLADQEWSDNAARTAALGVRLFVQSHDLANSSYQRTAFTSDLVGKWISSVEVVRNKQHPAFWRVRPAVGTFVAIESLKMICYMNLIRSGKFLAEKQRAKHMITSIYEAISDTGSDLLPPEWRAAYHCYEDDPQLKARVICDYISGMTNRFCVETYERLFSPDPPSIHKP